MLELWEKGVLNSLTIGRFRKSLESIKVYRKCLKELERETQE
ncbi:MAG: hypothetical protein NZ530_04820 [Thermodesulfobacteriaceae bacterium]|nr:hypothetical protein [Thermodesulfobacteriaceae bacterium]